MQFPALLSIVGAETQRYTHKKKKTHFQKVRTYPKAIPPNDATTAATDGKIGIVESHAESDLPAVVIKKKDRPP